MKLLRHIHQHSFSEGCVITLGNFDGVHIGHQQMIRELGNISFKQQLPSVLITFEPQPKEFLAKESAPARITSFREKNILFNSMPVDFVTAINFNKKFSQLEPKAFIENILVQKFNVKYILVGEDFRFGYQRRGDVELLQTYGVKHQFHVEVMPHIFLDGERVSSTRVREALKNADFDHAKKLLDRSYKMYGRVVQGDKRGRTIGFNTANILLERFVSPLHGVYAVKISGLEDKIYNGVANIGLRPTFGGKHWVLEVHIFDFNQDIYGKYLEVEFIKKIRDEKKFSSLEELKEQIKKDAEEAKEILNR